MKISGLSRRATGTYQFRMNVPLQFHKVLNKTCYYHDLGYDYSVAAKQAIRLRDKYKRLFRSLKNKLTSEDSGSSILNAHGIPARSLVGDEILYLPDSFDEATRHYQDYEDLPEVYKQASDILRGIQSVKVSEACARYIQETKKSDIELPVSAFISEVGDMDITHIRREHVYLFRDYLVSRNNSPATQRKRLGALSRLLTFTKMEYDLNINNPFSRVSLVDTKPVKVRQPFTDIEYKKIIDLCLDKADERRIALALIAITGARLSEITGMRSSDIHIDQRAVDIYENSERTLKTKNSQRSVPVVHDRVWELLVELLKEKSKDDPVFPSMIGKAIANSVSAVLVKFIKTKINVDRDVHSLRHTVATRLKRVMTPESVIEDICGWKKSSMLSTYAGSMDIETKRKWMKKALL